MWYDKDGKRVNSETVYLVEGDSTYTGVWTEYKPVVATGDSSNIALYAAAMFAFHRLHRRRCHPAPPQERRVIRSRRSTE